ncbi:MAG: hypothetical protein QM499_01155 [Flavobacteriaceae bacterium]
MKTTITTLRQQAARVNKLLKKDVFEIGERNGFKYFDFIDGSKSALFNSALSNKNLRENISAFYEGLIFLQDEETEQKSEQIGKKIVSLFNLKPTADTRKEEIQKFDTNGGEKTFLGIGRTVERIVKETI